jgi:hypothetical protein
MSKEKHAKYLQMFAAGVLEILENEKEWSADTMDEISYVAMDLGLADTDEKGAFRIKFIDRE